MYRKLIDSLLQTPLLPESLRQSLGNPVQSDRLPSTGSLQTEFPAAPQQKSAVKSKVRNLAILAALFCLLRSIPEYFLPITWVFDIWSILAFFAAATILCSLIGLPQKLWHWMVYVLGLPSLLLYISFQRSMLVLLILATLLTLLVADRFCKQVLYLGTTTPYPRAEAARLRSRWPTRFCGLTAIRGMEFYALLLLLAAATPWLIDFVSNHVDPLGGSFRIPATFLALAALVLLPIVVEIATTVFYARSFLPLGSSWQTCKRTVADWLCYNQQESQAPGVLQSPIGSSALRQRVLIACVYLWCAALNPMLSYQYDMREKMRAANNRPIEKEIEQQSTKKEQSAERIDAAPSLQRYQQDILDRLPPDEQAAYLESLKPKLGESDEPKSSESLIDSVGGEVQMVFADAWRPGANDLFEEAERTKLGFLFSAVTLMILLREATLLFLSFAFPLAFLYAISIRLTTSLKQQLESHPDTIMSFGNWNRIVDDVKKSKDENEAQSLILGTQVADGSPVMVPRKVFEDHAHILGDSGSGKTSMGIALILNQLIAHEDCSIVVLDLKGDDMALFRGAQMDAEKANKPFRWFTNELGKSTYAFNPLTQEYFQKLSLYQKTDIITAALGLQYGTDYGRGYYSDANADYLYRTLRAYPQAANFKLFASVLPTGIGVDVAHELRKDASHLISVTQRLAATEALNTVPDDGHEESVEKHKIDFADVFRKPQVVYMHLPSSLGSASSAEIARVALYSLLGSARQTPEKERKQVFLFIDEFQRLVAGNLELIMQTARSMKIGVILANQSMLDLKKAGVDLTPAVRTNTRYKQVFAASNADELREIIDTSGESLVHSRSFGQDVGGIGAFFGGVLRLNRSETTTPRMRVNDVLLATDAADQSIVQVRRGAGYAQFGGLPFVMRTQFHISEDEYSTRKNSAWPDKTEGTLIGEEAEPYSLSQQFAPVHPLAADTPDLKGSAEGLSGPLDELFSQNRKQLERRNRRKKNANPNLFPEQNDNDEPDSK